MWLRTLVSVIAPARADVEGLLRAAHAQLRNKTQTTPNSKLQTPKKRWAEHPFGV
jgi:hypothetical protein